MTPSTNPAPATPPPSTAAASTAAPSTAAPSTAAPTALLTAEVVRLVRASHGMRAQIHAAHGDGLEWAGSMLLFHLCKDGPKRSSALAAAVCVDPSTVSRQIADLVDLGLVERRADPQDGRASLLAATEAGQARHRLLHDRRDRAFAAMLADWSDDDVRALTGLLSRLNDTIVDSRASLVAAMTNQPVPTFAHEVQEKA